MEDGYDRKPLRPRTAGPPTLRKVSTSMFAAIAMWASKPIVIIAGTVMSEVLPVTTLTMLVKNKMVITVMSLLAHTPQS
jgi:hypothetical protein